MSIFKRVSDILRSHKQEKTSTPPCNSLEEARVGDIVHFDLDEYVIFGKAVYFDPGFQPHRYAYYLQNGTKIKCLLIEKGRIYDCFICSFIEGALDDPNDVPLRLELDGQVTFELENYRNDTTRTEGNTDFRSGDDVTFWRYFGPDNLYFFLQWQDGKFVALKGERTQGSQIKFLKSTL